MNFRKCGEDLPENETKCPTCGTDNSEDTSISAVGVKRVVTRWFSAKKKIIIIIIAAIAVVNSHSASSGAADKLKIAERYLSEQNHEQAVIEYQKILEIEPMNVDAYLGLADAYFGTGQTDKALEVLREELKR